MQTKTPSRANASYVAHYLRLWAIAPLRLKGLQQGMSENEISKVIVDSAAEVYRELGGPKLGLVINFGEQFFKNGIRRVVIGL